MGTIFGFGNHPVRKTIEERARDKVRHAKNRLEVAATYCNGELMHSSLEIYEKVVEELREQGHEEQANELERSIKSYEIGDPLISGRLAEYRKELAKKTS